MTIRLAIIACAALGIGAAGAVLGPPAAAAERTGALPPAQGQPETLPLATGVRVGGDDKMTRVVIDLTQRVDLVAFTLADPYRVVIDLPQIGFRLPADLGDKGRGLVKAFRYGLIMQGGSRIVFDTKGPVQVDKAFTIDAADGEPARLVLDLSATDRTAFLRSISLANRTPKATKPIEAPARDANDQRPLVVIDPGHGGIDNGAKGANGELEKDIVLAFGQLLRDRLAAGGKYRIAMTRTDDTFIPLTERVKFARSQGAALFLSIHCDSIPRGEGQAEGATVYTLSDTASDAEAARLAESENKADVIAGVDLTAEPDDVANILVDLAQRETRTFSGQFARLVVNELKTTARMHKHPMKSAGFKVLTAPDVPSVLVELGYMSTKDELKKLTSAEWQGKSAGALAKAVDTYFAPRLAGNRGN